MKRRTVIVAAVALGAAALFAVLFILGHFEPRLVVRGAGGRVKAELSLPDGHFSHVFIHSFHLTPVEERFIVERKGLFGARLHLYELRYESLGVGMPEDAELGYRLENGKFILSMSRRFDRIPIMVSILDGHGVVIGNIFHPFTDWVPKEGRVTLEGRMALVFSFRR